MIVMMTDDNEDDEYIDNDGCDDDENNDNDGCDDDDDADIDDVNLKTKNVEEITPFEGEPKPLKNPITPEEVRKSFNSLSNNKAPGEDQIHAELLKYGTPLLDQTIADIFNTTFSKHENLDINTGVLIAIQKPGKKKGPPNNLRPITLLKSLRKALSIITLNRIRPFVEEYLSKSQSGFRPDRSTADVVWTHKWLAAKTLKEDVIIKISGIDMSAAFDTIDRNQLLNIIATIVNEDELRIIRFLLSNTKIKTRINGATKTNTFISNVGLRLIGPYVGLNLGDTERLRLIGPYVGLNMADTEVRIERSCSKKIEICRVTRLTARTVWREMTETRRRAQAQSFCSYHLTKVFPPKQVRSLYRLHMKSARVSGREGIKINVSEAMIKL
ncbi:hypothetical protein RRG08_004450 [Elysia crispata]|uniref:Reverse transcriptase domain-containing protein n=1 Tax=Elysia crispata TaxID=231223 RepID=A0AAE1AWH7_9GAST|nr:hypothetical protein RRG08_004450 [Elysia crispata]